ncbi:hypothetical protein LTS18_001601, partial [Coniosporium uncinatum]
LLLHQLEPAYIMPALPHLHDMTSSTSAVHGLTDRLQNLTLPSGPATVFAFATVVLLSIKLRSARRKRNNAGKTSNPPVALDIKQPITPSPWVLPPAAPPAPLRYAVFRPDYSAYPHLQHQMPFTSTPTSFNTPPPPWPTIRTMAEPEWSFSEANKTYGECHAYYQHINTANSPNNIMMQGQTFFPSDGGAGWRRTQWNVVGAG